MRITETTSIPFAHLTEEYRERGESVVYVSGTGSVTVKFVNENGDLNDVTDGALTSPSSTIITHGINANLMLEITGGSEASPTYVTILPI